MTSPNNIFEIGHEGEKKAFEWLKAQGYEMFDKEEIGRLLDDSEYSNYKKGMGIWGLDEARIKEFNINQVKLFQDLGCILSDREKSYLKGKIILQVGDLIGKKDGKLTCFEVKTSKRPYYQSGRNQWQTNCEARKADIMVYYVFFDYGDKEKLRLVDIKELWFNLHLNQEKKYREAVNIITRKEAIIQRKKWYDNKFIRFEIIKCLKARELSLLSNRYDTDNKKTRYLIALNLEYLDKHFTRFDFLDSMANMYHSVSSLKDIPVFSYNLKKRREEDEYKEFNDNYAKYVTGYNLFIDFDGNYDTDKTLNQVRMVLKIYNEFKVPYYIMTSSFKGFHLHIPSQYMPKENIVNLLEKLNSVIYNLKGIYEIDTIDNSIVDMKRICKVPYSYVQDGSICLPLDDKQIDNFNPTMIKANNVLKNVMLINRGLLVRTHGLSEEDLKKNVLRFIKEFK